jgi:hypothetical protein
MLRWCIYPLLLILSFNSAPAAAELREAVRLWSKGQDAVLVTQCDAKVDHDGSCKALGVQQGARFTPLGEGYLQARVLWTKRRGQAGPDALVLGEMGGSGGVADLFAVTFKPRFEVRKMSGERFDQITVEPDDLELQAPFDVEFFNGAPHAGAISIALPMLWANRNFAIDLKRLARWNFTSRDLAFRQLAVDNELNLWAIDSYPAPRLFPPEARGGTPTTGHALLELMVSGHAEQARRILKSAWPRESGRSDIAMGGEADFWAALCRTIITSPDWRLYGLNHIPHADLIEAGAQTKR